MDLRRIGEAIASEQQTVTEVCFGICKYAKASPEIRPLLVQLLEVYYIISQLK